jgi:hypothetical protein
MELQPSKFEGNYYLFVENPLYNYLCSLYGDLIRKFENDTIAIIHKDSATAKKLKEYGELLKEKDLTSATTTLDAYNNTDYLFERFILGKLIKHIKSNFKGGRLRRVQKYFSSMFSILQSSGYGKSKLMEKLGSETPTFYSSLQQGSGTPEVSILLLELIKELENIIQERAKIEQKCFMNNISAATHATKVSL